MNNLRRRVSSSQDSFGGEYVDLGLPSGIKWCSHNVGGTNPEDYGYYFSWGNVDGYGNTAPYNTINSTYYSYTSGGKLTRNIPVSKTYDIARKVMGSPWRLPTKDEWKELYDNTNKEWVTGYNGTRVRGIKFMKKSDPSVYIFIPGCGSHQVGQDVSARGNGYYWSSTYIDSNAAYGFEFANGSYWPENHSSRWCGFSGRAVCD